jgi:hypothetical protein
MTTMRPSPSDPSRRNRSLLYGAGAVHAHAAHERMMNRPSPGDERSMPPAVVRAVAKLWAAILARDLERRPPPPDPPPA